MPALMIRARFEPVAARVTGLVAGRFARWVKSSSPERLESAMRGPSGLILMTGIFGAMPARLRRDAVGDLDAVVHWKVRRRADREPDVYELVIADGRAATNRRLRREPRLTIELGSVPFLKLVAGLSGGPELFMSGQLSIVGDLALAMRLPALFQPAGKSGV